MSVDGPVLAPVVKPKRRRTTKLSVTFVDGFAEGWAFEVPEWFRGALDIAWTPRVETDKRTGKKRDMPKWTEGVPPVHSFNPGDIIYDNRAGYTSDWRPLKLAIQIIGAESDRLHGEGKLHGWVSFNVTFRASAYHRALQKNEQYRMSQDEFVLLLRTGMLPNGKRLLDAGIP